MLKIATTGWSVTVRIMRSAISPICTEPPGSSITTPSRVTTKVMLLIIPWFSGVGKPSLDQIIHTCSDRRWGAMSGTAGPRMKSSTSLAKALIGAHWLPMPASAAAPSPSLSRRRRERPVGA